MRSTSIVGQASSHGARVLPEYSGHVTPWRIFALVSGALFVIAAVRPIADPDIYWHLVLAEEMVARRSVDGLGLDWSYQVSGRDWMTTQWLSELIFYAVHEALGWPGISLLRVAVAVVFALLLAKQLLLPHRTPWAAGVYMCVLLMTFPVLQERPQILSLPLLVWLSGVALGVLQRERFPAPWLTLIMTAFWANLHGLWVLVPASLGLLVVGHAQRHNRPAMRRSALLLVASVAGGCLTPVGPRLLLSPLKFANATAYVSEWQPTSFRNLVGVVFFLLIGATVAAWARSSQPVPVAELVFVGGMCAFALLAMRNLPPAGILVAPVVLARLWATFPKSDTVDGLRERRALIVFACTLTTLAALVVGQRAASVELLPDGLPVDLAEQVGVQPGDHRVLNDYNVGGVLLLWGGPRTQVAIDGRADYYGVDYVRAHLEMLALQGDWQSTLQRSRANYALLEEDAPLVLELQRRGWGVLGRSNGYVLFHASKS